MSNMMRLQFELTEVHISPSCHLQIHRHSEENQKSYAIGELYGSLYDDCAQITNVLPFPKIVSKTFQQAQKQHENQLSDFNLDNQKIGWYFVSSKQNPWDELESMKLFEKYILTSFFLVYDSRVKLSNPYKAYRLKDQFATKENFSWADLQNYNLPIHDPLLQIPVRVKKNDLFELIMLDNQKQILAKLAQTVSAKINSQNTFQNNIEDYIESFQNLSKIQKKFIDAYAKDSQDNRIPYPEYCQYIGQALCLKKYQELFAVFAKEESLANRVFNP